MASLGPTDYLTNKQLDHLRGGTAFTQPSGLYAKLHTASPGAAGTTAAAGNTTRHQLTAATPAASGSFANTAALVWSTSEVNTNETYSHVSLWDASSAGNCLWTGALTAPVAVTSGGTFTIAIAGLTVSLTEAS